MGIRKIVWVLVAITLAYVGTGAIRGLLLKRDAEKYLSQTLPVISSPWSSSEINARGSDWLRERSRLKPEGIANLASAELGKFIEIVSPSDCGLKSGFDTYSSVEHTYAVCETKIRFEKKLANVNIRLVEENREWKINDFISID
jgi:hypothetical protein